MSGLLASGHVSPIGRTVNVLYFITIILSVFASPVGRAVKSVLYYYYYHQYYHYHVIFGIKIGFKMGVLGCKSDNLHPYRVGLIDKGMYLEAVSAMNR